MIVHDFPLSYYVEKIRNNEYFSQGMWGDGEWVAMFHEKIGGQNAEGTVYTKELCDELEKAMHFKADNFFFSTPAGLKRADWTGIGEAKIDKWLEARGLQIEFVEKDVWDKEARECRFGEFIKVLREKNVIIVSNKALRGLDFLNYDKFVEVGYPNCYTEIDRAAQECLDYGKPGVYLVSMGLPAALLIQRLHGKIPNSFFLDLGSVWDAFVGIGAQRGWRRELYADSEAYAAWKEKSLVGIYGA